VRSQKDDTVPSPEASSPGILRRAFVTGLFSGYAPIAPGTAGSVVGLCLIFISSDPVVLGILIVVVFILGVYLSSAFSTPDHPDPSFVVIDEVVGMWVSLFLIPPTVLTCAVAFLGFRFLDIVKPFPARQAERLPRGWGIMTDDLVAGIYTNLAVRLLLLAMESIQ
jgi:phosphatidylglycerophosphatase A